MRKLALALVVGSALLAGLLLFSVFRGAESTTALAPGRQAPPIPAGVEHDVQAVSRHALAVDTSPASATEPSVAPPVQATIGSPARRIHGTIVVSDERGAEHLTPSGSATVSLLKGNHGRLYPIEIVAGRWEIAITDEERLDVHDLVLEGRDAVTIGPSDVEITDDPIALHARWRGPVRIHVIDSRTRLPLSALTLVRGDRNHVEIHPGEFEERNILLEGASSPLEWIPPEAYRMLPNQAFFVISPGYAWGRVRSTPASGPLWISTRRLPLRTRRRRFAGRSSSRRNTKSQVGSCESIPTKFRSIRGSFPSPG